MGLTRLRMDYSRTASGGRLVGGWVGFGMELLCGVCLQSDSLLRVE